MNDLPPLPEPVRRGPFGGIYTGTQMRAHARAYARAAVEAERDMLKDKVDSLEAKIRETEAKVLDDASITAKVTAKVALLEQAKAFEVDVKADMSDIDIKKAVIMKVAPKANLDGKNDLYIDARYDATLEYKGDSNDASVRELNQDSHSEKVDVVSEAKAKYLEMLRKKK